MVWTASPEVIRHLTTKRDDFPKPLKNYKALDIFGRNVVTTEGLEWKNHRKITAPGFSEKSNVMVFRESVAQTQGMLRKWENESANGKPTLTSVPEDTMRLTLYIISRVGFGVRLLWKGEEPTAEDKLSDSQYSSSQPAEGHTMSFENSLESLLANLIWVLLLPKWLIS
jgi:cytochrome P450